MKKYKKLNIRGTLLDRGQLAKYIEKIAYLVYNNRNLFKPSDAPASN